MVSGVSFPADARGVRSTTGPAKSVWAAAALGLGTEEGAALAAELLGEKDWRHGYAKHAVRLAELQDTLLHIFLADLHFFVGKPSGIDFFL